MNAQATTPTERVRETVREYLDTPESYPLVVPAPCPRMQGVLDDTHNKARHRRFDDEARITAMGDL